ncbi:hypothetical protein VTN00DRAFT_8017 [Thermoascus crustaceus]|uniref:uncharacterized protein n=1 Tax=Thermoascus crustaceus TaxID=5088 RepID=UPI0037443C90
MAPHADLCVSEQAYPGSSSVVEILARDKSMPIAIVGMACRLPGDAVNPDKLWDMCARKQSAWSEVPKDRFNIDAFYHPNADRNGCINNRGGYFLKEDIAAFDASFFSISPAEAKSMDPQQRILLESVYEALENAGIPIEQIAGTNTSCFVGCFSRDYYELLGRDPETAPLYFATGNGSAILSNRVSHFYDLKGASVTLDTACSSSLVALHLACQSLRNGESNTSIVGATNLVFSPDIMIAMSNLHFFSPDSRCYTFDARGNGYSRGEGVAAIILKPLKDALRDNDTIRAVIRGTVCNQDGRTAGIMLPSKEAQEALIHKAYAESGCDPAVVGYFEAHGTGTQAGDPTEAGAIGATLGQYRPEGEEGKLFVGSVKTNIGHLEGSSGLASVIRTVMGLERGAIAPNLGFENPNERIDFDGWRIRVPTELVPWPLPGLRRASVNSFGYGGTNAHAILDDAYHYLESRHLRGSHRTSPVPLLLNIPHISNGNISPAVWPSEKRLVNDHSVSMKRNRIFIWSAHEEEVAKANVQKYAEQLGLREEHKEEEFLNDLAYTLCERRSYFPWTCFVIADSQGDLVQKLQNTRQKPIKKESHPPRLGFVFTGQGAQWWAMGRELLTTYPTFLRTIQEADKVIKSFGGFWSILKELQQDEKNSLINAAFVAQPICTAIQIALVELFREWGIRPQKVIGHSSGEIAAAYAIGALTLESAMKVAYFRGLYSSLLREYTGQVGGMLAANISEADANDRICRLSPKLGNVVVACVNSPTNVTISGDDLAIAELESVLTHEKIFVRRLKVGVAYHSHHMLAIAEGYRQSISDITIIPAIKRLPIEMVSTVTGTSLKEQDLVPDYFVQNMVSCVRFSDALQELCIGNSSTKNAQYFSQATAVDTIIEIGPHSALAGPIKQILTVPALQKSGIFYYPSLVRKRNATETTLELAATLFSRGYPVNIHKINFPRPELTRPQVLVDLPSYHWNHSKRYWAESRLSTDYRFRLWPRNDYLGAPETNFNPMEPRWRNLIRLSEQPWVKGHQVQGSIVYPAAGYICMALEAARQTVPAARSDKLKGFTIRDLSISRALVVPETEAGVETMFCLRPSKCSSASSSDIWNDFIVYSWTPEGWNEHCRGLISTNYSQRQNEVDDGREEEQHLLKCRSDLEDALSLCRLKDDPDKIYTVLRNSGLDYGPEFQNLVEIVTGPGKAVATIQVPDTKESMPQKYEYGHLIHPATMDSFIQLLFPALTHKEPYMPVFLNELFVSSNISAVPGHRFRGLSELTSKSSREAVASISIVDESNLLPVCCFDSLRCTALRSSSSMVDASSDNSNVKKLCFNTIWEPDVDLLSKSQADHILTQCHVQDASSNYNAEVEMVAFYFFEQVLKNVGEDRIPLMSPHQQKFFRYMQHQHDSFWANKTENQNLDWRLFEEPKIRERMEQMITRVETAGFEGQLLCRVGRNLIPILNKVVDPLALMLEDGLLDDYYTSVLGTNSYARLVKYVSLLSHKNPDLEILEIGAGTGGATAQVLNALGGPKGAYPRFKSYTYTDISSGFFEKAEERFKDWRALLNFRKLDIEEDPDKQGYEGQKYDVVLASSVLHATRNIDNTLTNVRKLLKPGGKLIMMEVTHTVRLDLIFGTLPGWWMSEEPWREWGPTLTEEQWRSALIRNDFSDFLTSVPDHPDPRDQLTRVMVAKAIETKTRDSAEEQTSPELVIIDSDGARPQSNIISALQNGLRSLNFASRVCALQNLSDKDLRGKFCISLVELVCPLLKDLDSIGFDALKRILRESRGLLWLTKGACGETDNPECSLIQGLARTLRSEYEELTLVTLDFDSRDELPAELAAERVLQVLKKNFLTDGPREFEYSEKGNVLHIKRCMEAVELNSKIAGQKHCTGKAPELEPFNHPDRPLKLEIETPGLLDTLIFKDNPDVQEPIYDDYVEIEVKAVGLNFRDIMVSMGQLNDNFLGCECSGIVTKTGSKVSDLQIGDRVTAWTLGTFCNYIHCPAAFVHRIPDSMSYHVAASLPIVYCTAYYALINLARMRKGESVLIHAAAGGVGQAAIMLCQLYGVEIFATVGSKEKKDHLISTYNIPEDHIFSSRDLSFAHGVRRLTKGKGVDIVLNSLAGEALISTWKCIAPFGRFIEIGKRDIEENTRLDMSPFSRNVTFASVDLTVIFRQNKELGAELFSNVMSLVQQGKIRDINPITVFPFSKIEEAFRYMQTGKHMGKIVLESHADDKVPVAERQEPRLDLAPDCSYLIAGGLGGLGRSIARLIVSRGARNLILVSRSGGSSETATMLIEELTQKGARVEAVKCDITQANDLKTSLASALEKMPPLRGVVQAAMVLEDKIFETMPLSAYTRAIRPKVHGSWNLHEATLNQPLDFFIMLASAVGMVGHPSQANYAAGNTYQDALAHYRVSRGLPATTIDLGIVRSAGYVAESDHQEEIERNLTRWGFLRIEEEEFFSMLEIAMTSSSGHTHQSCHMLTGVGVGVGIQEVSSDQGRTDSPSWFKDPAFSHLHKMQTHINTNTEKKTSTTSQSLHERLKGKCLSITETTTTILDAITAKLAKSLMMNREDFDPSQPTSAYGVDSLVAVEVRNWLVRETKVDVPVFEILQCSSLQALAVRIAERCSVVADTK